MTHITHRAGVAATLFSFSRVLMAVSLGTWVWLGAAQATVRAQDQDGVRGAHEAVEDPGETFTDELGLTVPGAPIDHPGRVYPDSDDFPTGPDAGERLPDFTLPNQHGELIDFHADRNGRKAVVSFQRSAVW